MSKADTKASLYHRLGHQFRDQRLADQALTHRSFSADNNERLEFLGDSLLNFFIADALYDRFRSSSEGELSRMRAKLVKGETLAEIAKDFQLGEFLNLGHGERKSGGQRRDSILADTLEALIGALYLDAGLETCRLRVLDWYASRLAQSEPGDFNKDPKTRLQEMLQSKAMPLPRYQLMETSGAEHRQQFVVACEVAALDASFTGRGSSRRAAEQAAAEEAIVKIKQVWEQ